MKAANRDFKAALVAPDAEAAITADDAFHGIFVELSGNHEIPRALDHFDSLRSSPARSERPVPIDPV